MSLDNRLRLAVGERRVSTYPLQEILPCVNRILLQTYALVGFKPPSEHDLGLLIAKVATDLQESYPSLTLQEVELCFELGAKGEYGDFMGLKKDGSVRKLEQLHNPALFFKKDNAVFLSAPRNQRGSPDQRLHPFLHPLEDSLVRRGGIIQRKGFDHCQMAMMRFHITVTGFKIHTADKEMDILSFSPKSPGCKRFHIIYKCQQLLFQHFYLLAGYQVNTGKIFNVIYQISESHAIHNMIGVGSLTRLHNDLAVDQQQTVRQDNLAEFNRHRITALIHSGNSPSSTGTACFYPRHTQ